KLEMGGGGQEVIKNISLDTFILHPADGIGETINLYGESTILYREMSYHQAHVLSYVFVVLEVFFRITPEHTYIGHPPSVDKFRRIEIIFFVELFNFLLPAGDVVAYQVVPLVMFPGFRINEFYGTNIYVDGALYPSASTLLHTPPVLEAVGDKEVGGYRGDG